MDYRWLNNGNPDESESFKWNFMRDMVKPQMDIQGPGVGSLLYALNPETSELGLKQMDNELNLQLKANEDFDKRGQNALKFMEDRVQEDIKRKQLNNVDAGHFNSLMKTMVEALNSKDKATIDVIKDQIRRTVPNAEKFIAQAEKTSKLNDMQKSNYNKLYSEVIRGIYENPDAKEGAVKIVEENILNGNINSDDGYKLIAEIRKSNDISTQAQIANINAQINSGAGRGVKKTEQQLIEDEYKRIKAADPNISDAVAYEKAKRNVGVK